MFDKTPIAQSRRSLPTHRDAEQFKNDTFVCLVSPFPISLSL